MLESEVGRLRIKAIIDRRLTEAGLNPYEGQLAKVVDACSYAVQEILREYTKSIGESLPKP
ncbi:MAG: hypothetical protein M1548_02125 [Actinobacteria bacterium]|nr:hypothetical protein [Actinomycetota bacterium]